MNEVITTCVEIRYSPYLVVYDRELWHLIHIEFQLRSEEATQISSALGQKQIRNSIVLCCQQ